MTLTQGRTSLAPTLIAQARSALHRLCADRTRQPVHQLDMGVLLAPVQLVVAEVGTVLDPHGHWCEKVWFVTVNLLVEVLLL